MSPTSLGQPLDLPLIFLLLAIGLCLVPSILMNRRWESLMKAEKEVFATTYDAETAYNTVVNEVGEWRRRASMRKSLNPLKWWGPVFAVRRAIQPKLYRVVDKSAGILEFELTPIEGGGTSVKVSYSSGNYGRIRELRSKLPVKSSAYTSKVCPNCKRVHPPSYTHCPYCGVALT